MKRQIKYRSATAKDAGTLAAMHSAVAQHLTEVYGHGPWSPGTSEKGVLFAMRNSRVVIAEIGDEIVGTFRLASKKPWAIDVSYFTQCRKPIYLLAMAVSPVRQRLGIGRKCLDEAGRLSLEMGADAIRLDAYDEDAGAGGFYGRCGYAGRGRVTYRNARLVYYEFLLRGKE